MVLTILLALGVALVGAGFAAHVSAQNAADAAALAAAPVTFRDFGAVAGPGAEAARLAAANGAVLTRCRCPIDRSWNARTVTVDVERVLRLPIIGIVTVSAVSRATFEPTAMLGQ